MLVPDHAAMDPALSVHSFAKAEFAMFASDSAKPGSPPSLHQHGRADSALSTCGLA